VLAVTGDKGLTDLIFNAEFRLTHERLRHDLANQVGDICTWSVGLAENVLLRAENYHVMVAMKQIVYHCESFGRGQQLKPIDDG
jgi:hypothetical protein